MFICCYGNSDNPGTKHTDTFTVFGLIAPGLFILSAFRYLIPPGSAESEVGCTRLSKNTTKAWFSWKKGSVVDVVGETKRVPSKCLSLLFCRKAHLRGTSLTTSSCVPPLESRQGAHKKKNVYLPFPADFKDNQRSGSVVLRFPCRGKSRPGTVWHNNSRNAPLLRNWVNDTENCSNYCQLKVCLWALGELEEKIQTLSSKAISLHIVVCPFSECSTHPWDGTCGHG